MRKFLLLFLLIMLMASCLWAASAVKKDPYDLRIKSLYALPDEESKLIYDIPIEVKLLDVSKDTNWYKVEITFHLGPLGYTYVGWTKIPVGEILAEREKKLQKVAKAPN